MKIEIELFYFPINIVINFRNKLTVTDYQHRIRGLFFTVHTQHRPTLVAAIVLRSCSAKAISLSIPTTTGAHLNLTYLQDQRLQATCPREIYPDLSPTI